MYRRTLFLLFAVTLVASAESPKSRFQAFLDAAHKNDPEVFRQYCTDEFWEQPPDSGRQMLRQLNGEKGLTLKISEVRHFRERAVAVVDVMVDGRVGDRLYFYASEPHWKVDFMDEDDEHPTLFLLGYCPARLVVEQFPKSPELEAQFQPTLDMLQEWAGAQKRWHDLSEDQRLLEGGRVLPRAPEFGYQLIEEAAWAESVRLVQASRPTWTTLGLVVVDFDGSEVYFHYQGETLVTLTSFSPDWELFWKHPQSGPDEMVLRAEHHLNHSVATVHEALTQSDGIEKWWRAHFEARRESLEVEAEETEVVFKLKGEVVERWKQLANFPNFVVWEVDYGAFKAERVLRLVPSDEGTWVYWTDTASLTPEMRAAMPQAELEESRRQALENLNRTL